MSRIESDVTKGLTRLEKAMAPERNGPNHTPVPWRAWGPPGACWLYLLRGHRCLGKILAHDPAGKANATHIISCVNSHDALLAACLILHKALKRGPQQITGAEIEQIQAAVAKAEPQS